MSRTGDGAQSIHAWDGYWRHTDDAAAHRAGGRQEPLLALFWTGLFDELCRDAATLRVLDVACGNGAALGYLLEVGRARRPDLHMVGLDGSVSALLDLVKRLPDVSAVSADARFPPFAAHTFDIVCSQFGVEYGGEQAVLAAGRLVRPGGTFAAVMHLRDGGIYRECAQNLRAIDAIAGLLPIARATLRAGRGGNDDADPGRSAGDLATQATAVESVFRQHGREVAGGFAFRLYGDLAYILRHPARFDGAEVDAWLAHMQDDVATYRERMTDMLGAALNEPQYNGLMTKLTALDMDMHPPDQLGLGAAGAAGWILVGKKRG